MGDSSGGTLAATVTQLVRCMCNRRFNPNAKQALKFKLNKYDYPFCMILL